MSRKVQVTCDGCGRPKQETNHWFRAIVNREGLHLYTSVADPNEDDQDMLDLCGSTCVQKTISEWLDKK